MFNKTMKKLLSAMCFILVLSVMLSPVCLAAGDNYDTLVNWNIKIAVPDDTTAVLKGNEYYIYAQHEGSIPYVMLRTYAYDDAEVFLSDFTDYMKQQYSDLRVTLDTTQKMIGNKRCYETDYTYKVSGYDVRDRRIAILFDGMTYMFTSKEVEANGMTIGTMLEDVIANCEFLSDETSETSNEAESATLSEAYLYCLENGMPKYWLDFTGVMSDNPVLHCYFRSSDPTFYESWFILDLSTAVQSGNEIRFYQVYDEYDFDHSNWFNNLAIRLYTDGIVMDVDRNERTLAGGAEDNILTGSYIMLPAGAGVGFEQVDHIARVVEGIDNDGMFLCGQNIVDVRKILGWHLYGGEDEVLVAYLFNEVCCQSGRQHVGIDEVGIDVGEFKVLGQSVQVLVKIVRVKSGLGCGLCDAWSQCLNLCGCKVVVPGVDACLLCGRVDQQEVNYGRIVGYQS